MTAVATRVHFAWDDCILGEIANNAYAIICLWEGGGGGGGGDKMYYRQTAGL